MFAHRRGPGFEKLQRDLHGGVHTQAVDVGARDQSLAHRDVLRLHPFALQTQIVHRTIDFAVVDLPRVFVVGEVPVVMEVGARIGAVAIVHRRLSPLAVHRAAIRASRVPSVVVPKVLIWLCASRCLKEPSVGISHLQAVLLVFVKLEGGGLCLVTFEGELVAHMVHHDVDNDVHAQSVGRIRQRAKLLQGPKTWVNEGEVVHRILVVGVRTVSEDRRDPNSHATQTLDVRQLLPETIEVAAVPERHVPDIELANV
mmetsp:Transcript_174042/g.557980  ORF Transcript_174042/g.557980 Transcript_174042/m.557980 type:complete len:256 (-) Transcript_174042:318-1085(-)